MRRFMLNRWCAFVLTLSVGCFAFLASVGNSHADQLFNQSMELGASGSSGPNAPPPNGGDPDIPDNGLKGEAVRGGSMRSSVSPVSAAGDGVSVDRVWSWRVQAVLQVLRQQLWRF